MIDEIRVRNLALIEDAALEPGEGLTVLTGETGAGKTALLSALKLLVGERADASSVREGTDGLTVDGRFFSEEDGEDGLVVSRRVSKDGRSRVSVDGSPASVRELAERIGGRIDLCGQHEHQTLMDTSAHVALLDAWAGEKVAPALEGYRSALDAARAAQAELDHVVAASRTQRSRIEEARFAVERIEEVDPRPGELEELEETLPRAEHAEALVSCAYSSQEAISGESGALDALNSAIYELNRMSSVDAKLGRFADELASAAIQMEDVSSELRAYRESVEFDPEELARAQERLSALHGLVRAFGPRMEDVFSTLEESRELLSLVDDAGARERAARERLEAAEAELADAAAALERARDKVAPAFCKAVREQMARLEMGGAELVWDSKPLPRASWTRAGSCACELLYRSGAGLTPRPMRKIASGGELSRVLLAVKVVLGEQDAADTLVFDEVDAGVGGATARSLAAVLADLAKTHQVLVVTHLAQVAVAGSTHYVVSKEPPRAEGEPPVTKLVRVEGEDRVREVARMLSGDTGDASMQHARELLAEAGTL